MKNARQPEMWNDGPPLEDFLGCEGAPAVARRHLCFGGGKSGTATASQNSSISAPGNVTAWGTQVWNDANAAASQPFQPYTGEFTAPVNAQQNQGISNINTAAGTYAPYGAAATSALTPAYQQAGNTLNQGLGAGAGYTMAGAQPVSAANINQYMSPYIQNVVQATENQQNLQNQQQQSQLAGNAVASGAFGGDRAGVGAANLAYQQNLANQPVIAGLYNSGYNTALGAAQQQQQTELAAGNQLFNQGLGASQQQAALGSGLSSGLSNLGTTAQTNQLNAANAQLGAGTLQQQTAQAQDTALYNQFLQQQAYPFQTTQFLSNILQGTAPLYGSTSTTTGAQTAPTSFFSDERLKEDIEPIGKTFDGQNIVKFRYKGSPHIQVGLLAQNVEKHHPHAVGLSSGFKTVDYDEATKKSAERGHFAGGGLAGNDNEIAQLIAAQAQMYPFARAGLYGQQSGGGPYGTALAGGSGGRGLTPPPSIQMRAPQHETLGQGIQGANQAVALGENIGKLYKAGKEGIVGAPAKLSANGTPIPNTATGGLGGYGGTWGASTPSTAAAAATPVVDPTAVASSAAGLAPDSVEGLIADGIIPPEYRKGGRVGFAYGGMPYENQISDPIIPDDIADPVQVTQLAKPPSLSMGSQGQGTGLGGLSQLVGLGNGLMSLGSGIGSLFGAGAAGGSGLSSILAAAPAIMVRRGGRIHRDTGGGLDAPVEIATAAPDDTFETKILPQESGHQHFDKTGAVLTSPKGARGIAQIMPDTAPEAAKLAGVTWNPDLFNRNRTGDPVKDKEAEDYNRTLGKAYYNKQVQDFGSPVIAAAAYNAGPAAVRAAQDKAQKQGGSYLDYLPKETQNYVGGGGAPALALNVPVASGLSPAVTTPTPADPPNWFERNERPIISALTGLAGMASSPSRYLGSAILQGLGAGAQTYANMGYKNQELGLQGGQLGVARQQANTAQERVGIDMAAKNLQLLAQLRQIAAGYASKGAPVPPQVAAQIASLTNSIAGGAPGAMGNAVRATVPSPVVPASVSPSVVPVAPKTPPVVVPNTAVAGPGAPSAPPVSATPTAPPATVSKAATDPDFLSKLDPNNNPFEMQRRALDANQFSPGSGDKLMEQSQAILDKWATTGTAIDKDGNAIPIPGYKETIAANKAAETKASAEAGIGPEAEKTALVGTVGANRKTLDEAAKEKALGVQTKAQAQAMMDLYFDPQTGKPKINGGPAGQHLATLASVLKQAGFSDKLINQWVGTNPEDAQALEKLRTSLGSETAHQDIGGPVRQQEFQRFLQTTPSADLLPGAFKRIVDGVILPKANAQIGAYNAIADLDPAKDNIQKKHLEYLEKHPFYSPPAQTAAPAAPPATPAATSTIPTLEQARAEKARRKIAAGVQ